MNKLIDRLFEKDLVIKIASIVTAILIWFIVLDSDNPFEERLITVPLTSNVEMLQINTLQIVGTPLPASVDIKIKGRRQKISDVTANDFKVSIDLSEIYEAGTHRISINPPEYFGTQDVLIIGMNPSSVNLNFERIVGKQYPVEVEFTGSLPPGYEVVNLKVEPNIAILEEKESSISQISRIVAYVDLDEADNNKELVMRATALDANGNPIKQFDGRIPVIVSYNLAKNVPVLAMTSGNPMKDFYFKDIKYSMSTVRIMGSKNQLDGIKILNADPIDITDKNESFTTPLKFNLPKDIAIIEADKERISAQVIINKYITAEFSLPTSSVSIAPGADIDTMAYKVAEGTIPIKIKGKAEDINNIRNTDIRLLVQVNNLEPGEHEVPLIIRVPDSVTVLDEYSVNIVITSIPTGGENNPVPSGN